MMTSYECEKKPGTTKGLKKRITIFEKRACISRPRDIFYAVACDLLENKLSSRTVLVEYLESDSRIRSLIAS